MRQPFVLEDELGHIAYVIDIKAPGQMIKFVLYYGGEKPLQFQRGFLAGYVRVIHSDMLRPRDKPAQTRHRQAPFPVAGFLRVDNRQYWIEKYGERYGFNNRSDSGRRVLQ